MRLPIAAICLVALATACNGSTPTSPTETDATNGLDTFSSSVNPGGSASREFTLAAGGDVAVTLTTTAPPDVRLGLGIGIPRSNGSCALSDSVQTAAGSTPQITLVAEAARYCARVYDPGTVTQPTTFTIVISRP